MNHAIEKKYIWLKVQSLLVLLMFLAGCRSGPRALPIDPPYQAIDTAMKEAGDEEVFDVDGCLPGDWWTLFDDDQLSNFIQLAFARNPTLQAAHSNILLAIANANSVRSVLYPNIIWGGDVSRQKFSETGIIPFNTAGMATIPLTPLAAPAGIGIPLYFTQYETELTLTYDFDIWNKNRNTWRAAISEVKADIADEAFSRLQLGISVAQIYFQLQIEYERQEIAQALVKNKTTYLELVNKRANANLDNLLTVRTAENSLAQAEQALLQIQGSIAVDEIQLRTYLAGDFEEQILPICIIKQPLPKVPLPADIPLNLVGHRPDIVAQLWLIESAGRQIDVARAGFYPDFNLTALGGFQTIHLHELFLGKSSFFNIDPAFTLPIFDGGRLVANLRGSEVNYDLAIFRYNDLILNAAKEVLQGIAVLKNTVEQLEEFKKMVVYQRELYQLMEQRVMHHLNSDLDSLTSEGNLLMALDQQAIALRNTFTAILSLIKALGGGYDACGYM